MAASSSNSSQLALHLADRALTPILSSSRQPSTSAAQSRNQAQGLSALTTAAITAYESALRLGLGVPERIMIETQSSGPIVLHSYLNPQSIQRPRSCRTQSRDTEEEIAEQTRSELRPVSGTINNGEEQGRSYEVLVNGVLEGDDEDEENNSMHQPPMLIASVIAPSAADSGEARRAAARLERTGRTFQREWAREQEESRQPHALPDEDDG
ncbi:uncharacterized protein PAC_03000 [Phialocephala subalpina]|uniref:Uncharacterized protein n=1 Tax=Phialocephala subalpina TaxID=576137 RepID=A0A1L7WK21_9HELO|nr:uncharacterized protein PAC_03000 [Phialocephala subalpina]